MRSDVVNEIFSLVEAQVKSQPSPIEFEMAYQIRVAIGRIRFAIKAAEKITGRPRELQEANFQLLDALDRLGTAERNFQRRFYQTSSSVSTEARLKPANGQIARAPNGDLK